MNKTGYIGIYGVRIVLAVVGFMMLFGKESYSQQGIQYVSGSFLQTPFARFAQNIEACYPIRFYYDTSWVQHIEITAQGDSLVLSDILRDNLLRNNVRYYIDNHNNVFLTGGKDIVSSLPDFSFLHVNNAAIETETNEEPLYTAKNHLTGRNSIVIEDMEIGKSGNSNVTNAQITGKIVDKDTYEPLVGATFFIEELKTGAVTDFNGVFNMTVKPGKYTSEVSSLGMRTKTYYLTVHSAGNVEIQMEKALIALNEVQITANQYHNVKGMQMGFEQLSTQKMKEIPVVMGEKDIVKVSLMLPGVQSVGEGSAGVNVRGGSADQNMFYLNEVPVYNTSHLFGFFSAFNPAIIKDFSLYKSNIPVNYGGRVASVFDITTRRGNKIKHTAYGGISPVTGNLAIEGPLAKEKTSYVLSARSSYSDWILKRIKNPDNKQQQCFFLRP
ncbi:MAG: TonB-dependent receptor plug domain-containing protein, partial [Bacteroidales bacterium]|nr:TonB-dependent receptor plug domain-containing protein [Bacteroidales bacterium]